MYMDMHTHAIFIFQAFDAAKYLVKFAFSLSIDIIARLPRGSLPIVEQEYMYVFMSLSLEQFRLQVAVLMQCDGIIWEFPSYFNHQS